MIDYYDRTPFPDAVVDLIAELARRPDVHAVTFPFVEPRVWRILAAEQVARANRTGRFLQNAFGLCGPDSGLPFDTSEWGAYVHIPYEGMCGADFVVRPKWRVFSPDKAMSSGLLSDAISMPCHHLLLQGEHPELPSTTRRECEGWTLYSSTLPYDRPYHMWEATHFDPDLPLPKPWYED